MLFIFNNILFLVVYECIIYCFLLFVNNLFKKSLTKPRINSEISLSIPVSYTHLLAAKDGKTKLRKVAVNIPQKLAEWGVEMEKMMKYTGGTYDL